MKKDRGISKKTQPTPRRKRRDAGSRRPTTRDIDILYLGAEQTFVRFDTVGEWLAPDCSPATEIPPPAQLEDTTPSAKRAWPQDLRHRLMAVSRLMRKLEAQGYVEMIQPWANQPAWFRVTTRGLRSLNLDWEEIPFPEEEEVEARLRHDPYFTSHHHMVNEVRMLFARGDAGALLHTWKGERALEEILPLREQGTRRPQKADAIVSLQENGSWDVRASNGTVLQTIPMQAQQSIGIEVECTQKSNKQLLEILSDLLEHHDFVWYFCLTNSIHQAISDACRDAFSTVEQRQRIRILKLEEYLPCP